MVRYVHKVPFALVVLEFGRAAEAGLSCYLGDEVLYARGGGGGAICNIDRTLIQRRSIRDAEAGLLLRRLLLREGARLAREEDRRRVLHVVPPGHFRMPADACVMPVLSRRLPGFLVGGLGVGTLVPSVTDLCASGTLGSVLPPRGRYKTAANLLLCGGPFAATVCSPAFRRRGLRGPGLGRLACRARLRGTATIRAAAFGRPHMRDVWGRLSLPARRARNVRIGQSVPVWGRRSVLRSLRGSEKVCQRG